VLIGIFVIAAILTPPDAISQTIMAVPMYLLYEGGLLMARLMQRMRSKTAEA
jgi:sec-independent protein translocase protein TatC